MRLEIKKLEPSSAKISISDELDLYSASQLRPKIEALFSEGRTSLVLDLSGLSYLDSSGVGVLIFLLQGVKRRGGKLAVLGLGGTPKKVLEMSNIISLLPLAESLEQAQEMTR